MSEFPDNDLMDLLHDLSQCIAAIDNDQYRFVPKHRTRLEEIAREIDDLYIENYYDGAPEE